MRKTIKKLLVLATVVLVFAAVAVPAVASTTASYQTVLGSYEMIGDETDSVPPTSGGGNPPPIPQPPPPPQT